MDIGEFFQMATDWNGERPMTDEYGESVNTNKFSKDFFERVLTTFVAGFVGAVGLDVTDITDLGWKAWLVAGVGAGILSAVKGIVAKFVGNKDSASLTSNV